jgi:ABC-type uncharacterized transport system substrate-binding protein
MLALRRREFISLLGGATMAWPLTVRAQQAAMPVVGFLDRGSSQGMTANLAAFSQGLGEVGYTEGKNVTIDYRWAESRYEQLPVLAAELVRQHVDVIAATRTSAPAIAAKAATSTIPIVFQTGGDPVRDGLVAALNRPGGNVTGVTRLSNELNQKRFGLIPNWCRTQPRLHYWKVLVQHWKVWCKRCRRLRANAALSFRPCM